MWRLLLCCCWLRGLCARLPPAVTPLQPAVRKLAALVCRPAGRQRPRGVWPPAGHHGTHGWVGGWVGAQLVQGLSFVQRLSWHWLARCALWCDPTLLADPTACRLGQDQPAQRAGGVRQETALCVPDTPMVAGADCGGDFERVLLCTVRFCCTKCSAYLLTHFSSGTLLLLCAGACPPAAAWTERCVCWGRATELRPEGWDRWE